MVSTMSCSLLLDFSIEPDSSVVGPMFCDTMEPNDTPLTASPITPGTIQGSICRVDSTMENEGDRDNYSFTVGDNDSNTDHIIEIEASFAPENVFDIRLYRIPAVGDPISRITNGGNSPVTLSLNHNDSMNPENDTPNQYVIEIYDTSFQSNSPTEGDYSLTVTIEE